MIKIFHARRHVEGEETISYTGALSVVYFRICCREASDLLKLQRLYPTRDAITNNPILSVHNMLLLRAENK